MMRTATAADGQPPKHCGVYRDQYPPNLAGAFLPQVDSVCGNQARVV